MDTDIHLILCRPETFGTLQHSLNSDKNISHESQLVIMGTDGLLWQTDNKTCQFNAANNSWKYCKSPQKAQLYAERPSAIDENSRIKHLPFINRIVIEFHGIPAKPVSLDIALGDDSTDLAMGIGSEGLHRINHVVSFEGSDLIITPRGVFDHPTQEFQGTAHLRVIVNVIYPEIKSLRVYLQTIILYARVLSKIQNAIIPSADLFEIIAALEESELILNFIIDSAEIFEGIFDITVVSQIRNSKERLDKARNMIEVDKVQALDLIRNEISIAANSLAEVNNFVESEIKRLKSYNNMIQEELKDVILEIEGVPLMQSM